MAHILTNEMLLENTISVSQFIPSMLISFMYFFYLDFQVSTDIQAIDGLIGAVILNSQSYITSANMDYIPLPPFGKHQVQLCADSRYSDDDDPLNGPNHTLLITAIWLPCPSPAPCSHTRSSGGLLQLVILYAHHSVGWCLVWGNFVHDNMQNLEHP